MQPERDLTPKDTLHMRVEAVLIAKDIKLKPWEKVLMQKEELLLPKQLIHTQKEYRQQLRELMALMQRVISLQHRGKDLMPKVLKLLLPILPLTRKVETLPRQENALTQREIIRLLVARISTYKEDIMLQIPREHMLILLVVGSRVPLKTSTLLTGMEMQLLQVMYMQKKIRNLLTLT